MWLFDTSGFTPRWACGDWGSLGWIKIAAHFASAAAYLAIPFVLLVAARSRVNLPFRREATLFAVFLACGGVSHAISAVVFWTPLCRLLAVWEVAAAVTAGVALVYLVPVIPRLVGMRPPQELEAEIAARKVVELALSQKITELERTEQELRHANRDLQHTLQAKKLLEQRVRELAACHLPDHTGATPTQAAIARMNEATRAVAATIGASGPYDD
jgi:hypothetical protein